MRNTASLPGSNFRLAAIVALAAVTVGVTVLDFEVTNGETAAPAETASLPATSTIVVQNLDVADDPFIAADVAATDKTIGSTTTTVATELPPPTADADDSPVAWLTEDFEATDPNWSPMSGTWALDDGRYVQSDAAGYDLIAQYSELPPTEFSISVTMTPIDSDLGGGVLIGQTVLGSRRGATLIDFTNSGMFLRWGVYNPDTGQHEYQGGLAMPDDFDPAADHELTVEARSSRTMVIVDGAPIADFSAVAPGHVGLATSVSAIAFDDLEILAL